MNIRDFHNIVKKRKDYTMKKTGFTLAEVLITLAIIGVVATMTLPALMTNTQEQQAKTGLKKGINTLTEAAQTNLAVDGFDYGGIIEGTSNTDSDKQSMGSLLINRTQVDYKFSDFGTKTDQAKLVDKQAANCVIFFRDGSAVSFPSAAQNGAGVVALADDGLPKGFAVVYDYNGAKKPNLLSNCKGEVTKNANDATKDESDVDKCTKDKRVIKDQFGVKLRGGYAFPNGAAARWAFNS